MTREVTREEYLESAADIAKRLHQVADSLQQVADAFDSMNIGHGPTMRAGAEQYRGAAQAWEALILRHSLGAGSNGNA